MDEFTATPFAGDGRSSIGQVNVVDVEAQDLLRPGGRLVEQAPERSLA